MLLNTPPEIVTELIMSRVAYPNHTFVLVEGKTDKALWTEFKADLCNLFPPIGKEKAIKVLQIITQRNIIQGVVAIIDPDFWLVEQADQPDLDNLLVNDMPDLEMMLVTSLALEKLLRHTLTEIDIDKLADFTAILRETSLKLGMEYGYFRWIDYRHREYNLSFNKISFSEAINSKTLQLDTGLVAEKLVEGSTTVTKSQLLEQVEILRDQHSLRVTICRGHDVLSIMAHILPILFKSKFSHNMFEKSKIQTQSNELSRGLRIAYEYQYFMQTELFNQIRNWESNNNPFRIIK